MRVISASGTASTRPKTPVNARPSFAIAHFPEAIVHHGVARAS